MGRLEYIMKVSFTYVILLFSIYTKAKDHTQNSKYYIVETYDDHKEAIVNKTTGDINSSVLTSRCVTCAKKRKCAWWQVWIPWLRRCMRRRRPCSYGYNIGPFC